MANLFDAWLTEIFAVIFTLCASIYLYFALCYQHWKNKGIPYLVPTFPFGNLTDVVLRRKSLGENLKSIYRKLENHKVGGYYQVNQPTLMIRDPDMIRTILVKDFAHFQDHGVHTDEVKDPLSGNLFMLGGVKWRHLRQKLSSSFSPGKTRKMSQIFFDVGEELEAHLAQFAARSDTIEVMDIVARYMIDNIASCAYGIQSNSLQNPDAEFRTMGRKVLEPTFRSAVRNFLMFMAPKIAAIFYLPITTPDVSDFFHNVVKETVNHREQNNITRNDFLQLLIDLKNNNHDATEENGTTNKDKNIYDVTGLSLDQLTAQVFFFFLAGYEQSMTTTSYCLYELALNQGMQDRLREEIESAKAENDGMLTYDAILGMDYMARVVLESLRKYPPFPFLPRVCTKAYQLPGSDVKIELGTAVVVPTLALHHDPRYYPRPDVFDPDRFTEKAKGQRHHYVYLPFGEGPRICIASKFSELQIKIAIAAFITKFKVSVCERDTAIPLVMDPTAFLMTPIGGIKLKISERR